MKNKLNTLYLLMMLGLISGCAVIGGIFKAGVAVGIFMVVLILVLVAVLMSKMRNK
jgi:hypothetical protein